MSERGKIEDKRGHVCENENLAVEFSRHSMATGTRGCGSERKMVSREVGW